MKSIVLYHPKSEHSGRVEDYARDFQKLKRRELELVSLETVKGAEMAKLYDITSYPALLIVEANGQLYKIWQGGNLPLLNELESNLHG